jgi:hypothetical protein
MDREFKLEMLKNAETESRLVILGAKCELLSMIQKDEFTIEKLSEINDAIKSSISRVEFCKEELEEE